MKKAFRTIISIVFIIGTIAIIVYDAQSDKKTKSVVKQDSSKVDSAQIKVVKK